jgi:acetylornithine deacetylase/succinyl-diaminopimelate desuccinylase-like protein
MTDFIPRLIDLAIRIQQIPAPTFEEGPRAAFVRDRFLEEGLADVSQDALGNVYARLPGRTLPSPGTAKEHARPLIVSAHLDTVFPVKTDLQVRREPNKIHGPGLGDNSLGVAALIGLVWKLREQQVQLPGDVWLAADVGEEGLGDLRGMRAVLDRFGPEVRAYLIVEGLALSHVYHRAVGVQRYRITARTQGGHSWSDHGRPSAIHELARLVTTLTRLRLPAQPRTTLNVGTISGGTTVNTIASEARLELDLRSEREDTLADLIREVEDTLASTQREGVVFEAGIISRRPPGEIPADHPLIQLALECVRAQGLEAALTAGSTDANIPLSRGLPAVVLGVTTGGGAHTINEFIDVSPIGQGMAQLVNFVSRVWQETIDD